MRLLIRLALALWLINTGTLHAEARTDTSGPLKGVCLVAPRTAPDSNPLEPVKELGANYVAVIPYAFCRPDQPEVKYHYSHQWWGETVKGVKQTIAYAREYELKVMLKPHLWVGGEGWPAPPIRHISSGLPVLLKKQAWSFLRWAPSAKPWPGSIRVTGGR